MTRIVRSTSNNSRALRKKNGYGGINQSIRHSVLQRTKNENESRAPPLSEATRAAGSGAARAATRRVRASRSRRCPRVVSAAKSPCTSPPPPGRTPRRTPRPPIHGRPAGSRCGLVRSPPSGSLAAGRGAAGIHSEVIYIDAQPRLAILGWAEKFLRHRGLPQYCPPPSPPERRG